MCYETVLSCFVLLCWRASEDFLALAAQVLRGGNSEDGKLGRTEEIRWEYVCVKLEFWGADSTRLSYRIAAADYRLGAA